MTYNEAINHLTSEAGAMSQPDKGDLETALNDVENGTQSEKEEALIVLNDLYWDATWLNQNESGQAIFCLSYTISPNSPKPVIRS